MADTKSTLLTVAFSYAELNKQGFDPLFVEDYLNQISNIRTVADVADEGNALSEDNRDRLDVLEPKVEANGLAIALLNPVVADNTDRLDIVEPKVTNNTDRLDIAEPKITANENAIDDANGQLVGNMDYATASVGGVVDLAALIADLTAILDADLTPIITADIGAAPATYDQTYTQSVTDLTNENKGKVNELVARSNLIKSKTNEIVGKVNEILAGQIASKQMSSVW